MQMLRTMIAAMALAAGVAASAPAPAAPSGTITVYTSQPSDQMAKVVEAFSKRHPGVKVELFRSGTTEVMSKLAAEFAAGRPQADVVLIADAVAMTQLKDDGRLLRYPEAPAGKLPAALVDPDKTFFGTKLITTGIVYNTRLARAAPKSWNDLLVPAAAAKAVARGEKAFGIIIEYMAFNAKEKGSPVDFVFPQEGVSAITQPVAVLKTSRNVEAAKAFVDWQLSEEAQRQSVAQGYFPIFADVAPPKGYPPVSALKIMPGDLKAMLAKDEENKRRFTELFGG